MARKRKKKVPPTQHRGQHRKVFSERVNKWLQTLGVLRTPSTDSTVLLRALFDARVRTSTLVASSSGIPEHLLQQVQREMQELFNTTQIPLHENGPEMLLREFLTVGQSIYFFFNGDLSSEDSPCYQLAGISKQKKVYEAIQQQLTAYFHALEEGGLPYQRLNEILWMLAYPVSRIDQKLYWITQRFSSESGLLVNQFELATVLPEQQTVKVENIPRPVRRVGWAFPEHGPLWLSIPRNKFENTSSENEDSLPVFIQSHALRRMEERLVGLSLPSQHFNLFLSLLQPEVKHDSAGQPLLTYYYGKHKLGYLWADVRPNMILIRTFLFVTMDSTPEGRLLREELGLEAEDKKYLALDRLSTFTRSDIRQDTELRKTFVQAGCEDLFCVDPPEEEDASEDIVQFIRSYMRKSKAHKVEWEGIASDEVPQSIGIGTN